MIKKIKIITTLALTTFFFASEFVIANDGNEPPRNPFLADSAWPMSHRTSYVQGSSPLPGPESEEELGRSLYKNTGLVNITIAMSAPYEDGTIMAWGSSADKVYKAKVTSEDLEIIDSLNKPGSFSIANGISGAYTLLDVDNTFFVPKEGALLAYGDITAGNSLSNIELKRTFEMPSEILRGDASNDPIVGINMIYDGWIAIATKRGTIAVISRDFMNFEYVQLGDNEEGEEVSNSIAVDEDGGIYVVTAKKMHRVQWTGSSLSTDSSTGAWSAEYEEGADVQVPGRLGAGSGSTPSLMGVGDQDKFVVITDGQKVANLVLFWRDEIPVGWQPIAPGKDIRIAAELPINYGDPEREYSMSEQSVLVRGYGAAVVSNDYGFTFPNLGESTLSNLLNAVVVFYSNLGFISPYGVQKFEWNPISKTLEVAWSNTDISCPNGIPTMSAESNLMYCIGQRKSVWNVEALDWDTGESVFHKSTSAWFTRNSFYAATQIGPNGGIWSGSISGLYQIPMK